MSLVHAITTGVATAVLGAAMLTAPGSAGAVPVTPPAAPGTTSTTVTVPKSQSPRPARADRSVSVTASARPQLRSWEWRRLDRTPLAQLTTGFAQFRAMGGTTLCLDISYVVDISEIADPARRSAAEAAYSASLGDYIAAAGRHGLTVEAVAVSPHWIAPDVRYVTGIVAQYVTAFNQRSARDLVGLHFDLEPWGTPEWATRATTLTQQLLATVAQIARQQAALPAARRVPVSVDLPFWLDGTTAPSAVPYGGGTMSPTEHVMRLLDNGAGRRNAVVVMAYRDRTSGGDGSLAVSASEFALAKKLGGRVAVVVGQEIGQADPTRITFFEEGLGALQSAMRTLTAAYSASVAWGGLAIDDFAALSAAF